MIYAICSRHKTVGCHRLLYSGNIARDMIILEKDMRPSEILDKVCGRKVSVWTCNTCARLCNGMGGDEAAERLCAYLRDNGVPVPGRA